MVSVLTMFLSATIYAEEIVNEEHAKNRFEQANQDGNWDVDPSSLVAVGVKCRSPDKSNEPGYDLLILEFHIKNDDAPGLKPEHIMNKNTFVWLGYTIKTSDTAYNIHGMGKDAVIEYYTKEDVQTHGYSIHRKAVPGKLGALILGKNQTMRPLANHVYWTIDLSDIRQLCPMYKLE
ncbi:MAG: hypothetical protein COW88_03300 [Candidatus Lloydbacteria bacterium CG22_combo_CG10-13_8_21_14_all_47_15]|uniref:Uncharacterized protein n=1 Tax=Candidatus Lloydbacteria bacterium CG22_combo_CG10-13_8_21_14_all_47_15 TaxID=1974635 RepID=A0A2H0CSV9_9BACT|nr:MAG: hypothetical protein COW88_03300 [Candidatus Lloydbacteria bacterium CG22_combo_CG10-13_8_21_14_all_47_15]